MATAGNITHSAGLKLPIFSVFWLDCYLLIEQWLCRVWIISYDIPGTLKGQQSKWLALHTTGYHFCICKNIGPRPKKFQASLCSKLLYGHTVLLVCSNKSGLRRNTFLLRTSVFDTNRCTAQTVAGIFGFQCGITFTQQKEWAALYQMLRTSWLTLKVHVHIVSYYFSMLPFYR